MHKNPDVPDGLRPLVWAERLEYLADKCEPIEPKLAEHHRARAARIRAWLEEQGKNEIDGSE